VSKHPRKPRARMWMTTNQGVLAARRLGARLKELEAMRLRLAGKSFEEIGETMCLPCVSRASGARQLIERALRRITPEPTEQVRELEVQRLDTILARLWPYVDSDPPSEKATKMVLAVMARRAKLLGLDAPTWVGEVHVNVDLKQLEGERERRWAQLAGTPIALMLTGKSDPFADPSEVIDGQFLEVEGAVNHGVQGAGEQVGENGEVGEGVGVRAANPGQPASTVGQSKGKPVPARDAAASNQEPAQPVKPGPTKWRRPLGGMERGARGAGGFSDED